MKAVRCIALGGPESLVVADHEPIEPGPEEVEIRVHAASVNFADVLIIAGKYQAKPPLPFTPGMELAGRVMRLGTAVRNLSPGDRVAATVTWGAFGDTATVPVDRVIRLKEGISFTTAAAFPLAYSTAYHALATRGRLVADEQVLVLGAAGGVGLAAVEIAKCLGARVVAAASSEQKLEICASRKADLLVNYADSALRDALRELRVVPDVVLDVVGGPHAEAALRSLGWRGRYLAVGFAGGEIPRFPANLALLSEREILGVYWGEYAKRYPAERQLIADRLMEWIAAGKLRPEISRSFPLERAPEAMRLVADRGVIGKVVLQTTAGQNVPVPIR